ncbi:MAG: flagellar protein FlgA [Herpetosiphonaceae bacterium]|nr:MAG: flagellar protein FlgA [Herpetosiphonaceae bacterium]
MSFNQPFSASQALTPKKSNKLPIILLVFGIVVALGAATYGYLQQARVETVVIAVRPIPFGKHITADDLGTIEVPYHRPVQLAGISDPSAVIGRWAAREIGSNDLIEPGDLLQMPPDRPVYPNGRQLGTDMVALPFATTTIGPLTDRDVVNLGFNDPSGDPALCQRLGGATEAPAVTEVTAQRRPYACRFLSKVPVLYIDGNIAYLEVTPYQAHAVWSLQAAGLQLWGERYGATSDPLAALSRMDAAQIQESVLTAPTETLKLQGEIFAPAGLPGSSGTIPGSQHDGAPTSAEQP